MQPSLTVTTPAGGYIVPAAHAAWMREKLELHGIELRTLTEYMEDYVAEEVAREMLKTDPALKAEFERKLAEDPAFAKNPAARLQFFYRRHSS